MVSPLKYYFWITLLACGMFFYFFTSLLYFFFTFLPHCFVFPTPQLHYPIFKVIFHTRWFEYDCVKCFLQRIWLTWVSFWCNYFAILKNGIHKNINLRKFTNVTKIKWKEWFDLYIGSFYFKSWLSIFNLNLHVNWWVKVVLEISAAAVFWVHFLVQMQMCGQ